MLCRLICLFTTLLSLSACVSDGSHVQMYGEISGEIEHTNTK